MTCYFSMERMLLKIIKICGALRVSVPFVQFKKREKHPWRIVNFSKVAGLKRNASQISPRKEN